MALTAKQKTRFSDAVVRWLRTNNTELSDLLALTPTEKRDALAPLVREDRDATIGVQAKLVAKQAADAAELVQYVDDCNQVLQDLDDAIVAAPR